MAENDQQPKKISRAEADKMKDFAQSLGDEITHVVDYGGVLGDEDQEQKKK